MADQPNHPLNSQPPAIQWLLTHKKTVFIIFLLLVVAIEGFIIFEQKRVADKIQAESANAFDKFLKQGKSPSDLIGTNILFRNVRFCWSPQICINARTLTATVAPIKKSRELIFDNLKSYIVKVHNSTVLISPKTLQGMFNESVFNYPGSTLRDLTVGIDQQAGKNHIKLNGSLNFIFWIPFEMDTDLNVDKATNTMLINVHDLKVFGIVPAKWILDFKPFNLEKLLPLPSNKHLSIRQNVIMVKPFGLFPPPRIDGRMDSVLVTPHWVQLQFTGEDPTFNNIPQSGASNFIYLEGGNARFGKIQLFDTRVQVIDRKPSDLFQFSLLTYQNYLPTSKVELTDGQGAVLEMDDHRLSRDK